MYVIIFNYDNIYHKLCGSITLDGYVNKDKTLLQGHIINYDGTNFYPDKEKYKNGLHTFVLPPYVTFILAETGKEFSDILDNLDIPSKISEEQYLEMYKVLESTIIDKMCIRC